MSKLAKYLISDLNGDWSKPSIKFFRSSGAYGYIIWLTIINCNFEKRNIRRKTFILTPFSGVSLIFETFYLHSKIVPKPRCFPLSMFTFFDKIN